ncbi:MAG TPA: ComEC/Rec2 family competence protein [Pyrinomonadaceae bacterium]|jgi:competence protein ComEC|nr:ComEC/Rec2 family competence protein [Pyrinomonadaceae bacterium]
MSTVMHHRPSFNSHPLALLAAAFAAGILLAHFSTLNLRPTLGANAFCTLLALVAFKQRQAKIATMCLVLAFVCTGAACALVERESVGAERVRRLYEEGRVASGDPVEVTGVVVRAPEFAPDGFYLTLRAESVRVRGAERMAAGAVELFAPVGDAGARLEYEGLELRRGARVRVLVALERAERFRNPGGSSLTEFLERRGIDAAGTIKSPLLVERLDDERVLVPLVWLDEWRERLRVRMSELFTAETAGVLQAALLGNRYGLSRASAERFREGGTFHVLVISGLHISFIGGLVLLLMRRLMPHRRAWQVGVSCVVLWAYAVGVGAEASVVRAALMFTLVALAPIVGRRGATLNALGGAALVLLTHRPAELFDPSFQLTFLSVVGIVALGWPLVERLREVGAWHPTRATPYPPVCPRWFRMLGESRFWSERAWRRELERNVYSYRLFKTGAGRRLERWRVQRVWRYAFVAMLVSASVQLMLLPFFVVYFHRVSLASVLLNIFVGALMAAASLGALAAMLLATLSAQAAAPLVWLVECLNWLMEHSVEPFARAGVASLRLPEYTGRAALVYVLYYVPLAVLLASLARWRPLQPDTSSTDEKDDDARRRFMRRLLTQRRLMLRLAWACGAVCLCLIVWHPFSAGRAAGGRLRLDLLDVGQGDGALLTFPDGSTLLVDAGGRARFDATRTGAAEDATTASPFERDGRDIGEAVVAEYLWWRGLESVDYILATHAHADHMSGLNDIARNFKVRAALLGRIAGDEAEFARFAETLRRERVPVELVGRGDRLKFGAVTVDVLWPPRTTEDSAGGERQALSENDASLVLRVRYGARVFLLTGDIERAAEDALVAAGDALQSDVVKVAHHGSRTSSSESFIAATSPSVAVVSVGNASPFGHPDAGVVARWRASGAQVLQTGRRGTVTISTDGRDLQVETYARE